MPRGSAVSAWPFTATVRFRIAPASPVSGFNDADGLALVIHVDARGVKALGGSGFGLG
jgi:hypothetical protein